VRGFLNPGSISEKMGIGGVGSAVFNFQFVNKIVIYSEKNNIKKGGL
jgi:hypothetical protein